MSANGRRTPLFISSKTGSTPAVGKLQDEKPSYKVKHSVENPVEKQAIFENHHEPIIDRETWERVQGVTQAAQTPEPL